MDDRKFQNKRSANRNRLNPHLTCQSSYSGPLERCLIMALRGDRPGTLVRVILPHRASITAGGQYPLLGWFQCRAMPIKLDPQSLRYTDSTHGWALVLAGSPPPSWPSGAIRFLRRPLDFFAQTPDAVWPPVARHAEGCRESPRS